MIQSGKQSDRSIYKWVIRMQPTYTINNKMSYILGISAYYHDAAAALIKDGEIIAAAQEERFTRIKNDASFPANAIRYCLQQAGILLCRRMEYTIYRSWESQSNSINKRNAIS